MSADFLNDSLDVRISNDLDEKYPLIDNDKLADLLDSIIISTSDDKDSKMGESVTRESCGSYFLPNQLFKMSEVDLPSQNTVKSNLIEDFDPLSLQFNSNTSSDDLGKIAEWTNLFNTNKIQKYVIDGNLNVPKIIELIGDHIPYNDIVKPYQKLKNTYTKVQYGHNKKNQRNIHQKSFQKPLPISYLKMFSSRRRSYMFNRRSYKRRRTNKTQSNLTEMRLFPTFVMIDSNWDLVFQFSPSDFEALRETKINFPKFAPINSNDIPSINPNYKIISPKCSMALKKVLSIEGETIDHPSLESFTYYKNDPQTHIYISADCLALLLAHQSSIHSFHLNVSAVGPKQIHIFIDPESPHCKAMVCGSSAETIGKIEQENSGEFWRICQEATKLNLALKRLCFKYDPENVLKVVTCVNSIKMGSKMVLQVLGYTHGLMEDKKQTCHLRTLLELPQKSGSNTSDWKTFLDVKKMTILLNENMKNRFQMIRWNLSALFSGVDQLCLAFTSRKDYTSDAQHSLLQVDVFDPQQYLDNLLSYDLQNRWDYARVILKKVAQIATNFDWNNSCMLLYYEVNKDYEKNAFKIFRCSTNYNDDDDGMSENIASDVGSQVEDNN